MRTSDRCKCQLLMFALKCCGTSIKQHNICSNKNLLICLLSVFVHDLISVLVLLIFFTDRKQGEDNLRYLREQCLKCKNYFYKRDEKHLQMEITAMCKATVLQLNEKK